MKDVVERILAHIPTYFVEFGRLFSNPKAFILNKFCYENDSFKDALIFAAISSVILTLSHIPLRQKEVEIWMALFMSVFQIAISIAVCSAIVVMAWRIVGWRNSAPFIFVVIIYFYTMINIIVSLCGLVGIGMFRTFSPKYYNYMLEVSKEPGLQPGQIWLEMMNYLVHQADRFEFVGFIASAIVVHLGFVIGLVWFVMGWGVFRVKSSLSRTRSFVAFLIAAAIFYPTTIIITLISVALVGPTV